MIRFHTLENGARVILEPVEHTDILSLGFWYLHGARDEGDDEQGHCHFLEHMLFKGTETRSAFEIARQIERVGGVLNAFTEKELTCFYCALPYRNADLAVEILADMLSYSLLDEGEVEKEKQVVINEIRTVEDNPEEKGFERFLSGLWNGHPLSRRITGDVEHVRRLRSDELKRFLADRYIPANLVVAAAGRFEESRLLEGLQSRVRPLTSGRRAARRRSPLRIEERAQVRDRFQQVHLFCGTAYPATGRMEDYYRELVLSTLFGESMSSRLFQRLREQEGLCYSVYSFRSYFTDCALWTVYANTLPQDAARLVSALAEELRRLKEEPPGESEVEDAKNQLLGSLILGKEDMENRMRRLARQYALTGKVIEYAESEAYISSVSSADVRSAIERMVNPGSFNLLLYGGRRIGGRPLDGFLF